ncbi:Ig-like domain-containing protein, partial [Paenibacillus rigui]
IDDGPNQPPVIENMTVHTQVNTAVTFIVKPNDPDNSQWSVQYGREYLYGTINVVGNELTYMPNPGFSGTAKVPFQVNDGVTLSNIAILTFIVEGDNANVPTVQDSSLITMAGQYIRSPLLGHDPNGDALTYQVTEQTKHGRVVLDNSLTFLYTPEDGYTGADQFKYRASDGTRDSGDAVVAIQIKSGSNRSPYGDIGGAFTKKNRPVKSRILAEDLDKDPVRFVVLNQPTLGTLDIDDSTGFFTFTPRQDAVGSELVWVHLYDGISYSAAPLAVRIQIDDGPNQPPAAEDLHLQTSLNTPVSFTVKGTDPDNTSWGIVYLSWLDDGEVEKNGDTYTYTPRTGFTGTRTIHFQLTDGVSYSNIATLTIIVDADKPTDQPEPSVFPQVQSQTHNVALKQDGSVWTWGYNGSGQLGLGDSTYRKVPTEVKGAIEGIRFKQVDAGIQFTLALAADKTVWGWGQNNNGELGDETTTRRYTPVQVKDSTDPSGHLTGVKKIQAGSSFGVALKEDGSVYTWGNNQNGELGIGNEVPGSPVPVKVPNLPPIKNIFVRNGYTMAIDTTGLLWAWGEESFGQLGIGTRPASDVLERSYVPVKVHAPNNAAAGWTGVQAMAPGITHVLALKDGKVYAWGSNLYGALGNGNPQIQFAGYPMPVADPNDPSGQLSNVIAIGAGWDHSYAIKKDGTVVAWGENGRGQLGDGTTTNRYTPVQVKWQDGRPFDGAAEAEGGDGFGVFTRQDGSVWAMGLNDGGQLGDGTVNMSRFPVKVKLSSSDANLSALTLSAGTLQPGFSSTINKYAVTVDGGVNSITLVPTTADQHATVTFSVYGSQPAPMMSGQPSPPMTLREGQNEIILEVTSEDRTNTKRYQIVITRTALAALRPRIEE